MDSQIYLLRFNNGESCFFAHEHYLKIFGYFDHIFSKEILLHEEGVIDIILDYHYKDQTNDDDAVQFKDSIGEKVLSNEDIKKKIFNKKIIQIALNIAYGINFNTKLNSAECYDLVMLMDYLQYDKMNDIENIIFKLYDGSEDFNQLVANHYDNCSADRIKKKLLEICICDKFRRQLFHYGYTPFKVFITFNEKNEYYIEEIKLNASSINDVFTPVNDIGDWIKFAVENFLKIFYINVNKFEFDFGIVNNQFQISDININDHILHLSFLGTYKHDTKLSYEFKFDLNTFVKNIIIKHYCK